jgi:hypothetical protein
MAPGQTAAGVVPLAAGCPVGGGLTVPSLARDITAVIPWVHPNRPIPNPLRAWV